MVTPSSGPGQTEREGDGLHSIAEGCQVLTKPFKKKMYMQHLLVIIISKCCIHVYF